MVERLKMRMICSDVQQAYGDAQYVVLHAVYSNDKESPNYSYSQATPSAELRLVISNPAAMDFYQKGHEYDFDSLDHTLASRPPEAAGVAHEYAQPTQTGQPDAQS